MAEVDAFGGYVEALGALAMVEGRERDALRKAVEASTAAADRAKTQIADQQRMYDRAARDAVEVDHMLDELYRTLGVRREGGEPPGPATTPPPLSEIRARIDEVARWAAAKKPMAESLMRTKGRVAEAPKPPVPPPIDPRPAAAHTPTAVIVAAVSVVVIVIVVIALIAR